MLLSFASIAIDAMMLIYELIHHQSMLHPEIKLEANETTTITFSCFSTSNQGR